VVRDYQFIEYLQQILQENLWIWQRPRLQAWLQDCSRD